jgi:hypothetical protein
VDQEAEISVVNQIDDSPCGLSDAEIIESLDLSPNTNSKGKSTAKNSKTKIGSNDDVEIVNKIAQGYYNANVNLNSSNAKSKGKSSASNGKSKETVLQNIKEELPNLDEDRSNMTLATLPSEKTRPALHRFNSV